MNDDSDIDDLDYDLGDTPSSSSPAGRTRPLRPGEVDEVRVHLDDDEAARVASAGPDDIDGVLKAILSDHKEEFEHLCDHFVEQDARYTVDDGSLEIEDCYIVENDRGKAYCGFTQSFYAGCRDANVDADPRECEFDLTLDRADQSITVSTVVPPEREPDEF